MGFGCVWGALTGGLVFGIRLEDGRLRSFGPTARGANASKEGLAEGFSVLAHTSIVRGAARLGSETG